MTGKGGSTDRIGNPEFEFELDVEKVGNVASTPPVDDTLLLKWEYLSSLNNTSLTLCTIAVQVYIG